MIPAEIFQTDPTAGGDRNMPDTSNMPVYTGGGPEKLHAQLTREAETAISNYQHDQQLQTEALKGKVKEAMGTVIDIPLGNGEVHHASPLEVVLIGVIVLYTIKRIVNWISNR